MRFLITKMMVLSFVTLIVGAAPASTRRVQLVSKDLLGNAAGRDSLDPDISFDGRYIVFQSGAHDLVEADTPGSTNVYVRDMLKGRTWLASVDSNERGPKNDRGWSVDPDISANGRYVAFVSHARYSPSDPWRDSD